jgi:transposase
MAKPYSQDLRDRVIDAVKRGEMSRRAAARRYEISESVAIKCVGRGDGKPTTDCERCGRRPTRASWRHEFPICPPMLTKIHVSLVLAL